ncbi:MAG TPA: Gfo/Idh/MocA family oxidoreductase [Candidatus Limnocylindrales bacterium]|nr:Gfo/Idh/MocA family oxidoreductase [Candidatus Limnocylindrales bacterium]
MARDRLRIGFVGCGDVAHRHYLPALAEMAADVRITAVMDPRDGIARAAAATIGGWSPAARSYRDLASMLGDGDLDAVIDLAPAPHHGEVNQAVLDAGLHLYSEKPLAGSIAEADRLIATAAANGLRFLCAPGVAVTRRSAWLTDLVRSERYGRATLVVAQYADPGPAAWREYTGDPRPFYREGVGPVFDHGVYRLHAMTAILGPARRVQAMGSISNPTRVVRGGPLTGRTIEVTTPDHVLVNMEFANGSLGQLLASFGAASTLAPWLEVHLTRATISFGGQSHDKDAPVSLYVDHDTLVATEGWQHEIDVPADPYPVVETGVRHFIDCLRGATEPILTAEHARHVLDITLKAYASIADGASHATETTF